MQRFIRFFQSIISPPVSLKLKETDKVQIATIFSQQLKYPHLLKVGQIHGFRLGIFKQALDVGGFLMLVAKGREDKVEMLLKRDRALLQAKGDVVDYSGREFKCITGLQYAWWARDKHMIKRLLKHWIVGTSAERQAAKAEVLQQIIDLETHGTAHGKSYDFEQVLIPLRAYIANYHSWNEYQRRKHLAEQYGKAQRGLVEHAASEMSRHDRAFYPVPTFNEPTLPRGNKIYNQLMYIKWFPLNESGLGDYCAYMRGGARVAIQEPQVSVSIDGGYVKLPLPEHASQDLDALTALSKQRSADLEDIKRWLRGPSLDLVDVFPELAAPSLQLSLAAVV